MDNAIKLAYEEVIERIAQKYLHFGDGDLKDRSHIYNCSAGQIKDALDGAFKAGVQIGIELATKP